MGIIRGIKRIFGIYDLGCEYWVDRKNINVNPEWRKTRVGREKWRHKFDYYLNTGEFESRIIVRRNDWMLVDGYSSFRIAEVMGIDKVPVHFI